jgi:hypothetical protein
LDGQLHARRQPHWRNPVLGCWAGFHIGGDDAVEIRLEYGGQLPCGFDLARIARMKLVRCVVGRGQPSGRVHVVDPFVAGIHQCVDGGLGLALLVAAKGSHREDAGLGQLGSNLLEKIDVRRLHGGA